MCRLGAQIEQIETKRVGGRFRERSQKRDPCIRQVCRPLAVSHLETTWSRLEHAKVACCQPPRRWFASSLARWNVDSQWSKQTIQMRGKECVGRWEPRVWVNVKSELAVQFSRLTVVDAGEVELYLSRPPDMKRLFVRVLCYLQGLCLCTPAHLEKASSSGAWSDWW
jgi:hypothetical protein